MKHRIISALLRLYPAAWRSEYGPELDGILLARPLGPRVIADVIWNGLWQRAQVAEPSTILGVVSILVVLAGFVLSGGEPSTWKILPTVAVSFLFAGVFAVLQVICGCWTHLRYGGRVYRSGLAAMKTSLIAGIPLVLGALLMILGLVDLRFPGTTLPLSPSAMVFAPLARLPDAWIWGALGGLLGKCIERRRHKAGVTPP